MVVIEKMNVIYTVVQLTRILLYSVSYISTFLSITLVYLSLPVGRYECNQGAGILAQPLRR